MLTPRGWRWLVCVVLLVTGSAGGLTGCTLAHQHKMVNAGADPSFFTSRWRDLPPSQHVSIDTIYGVDTQPSPVVRDLVASPAMQRLKGVEQFGPPTYHGHLPSFTRFQHSLGVYYLLKRFGAPHKEQIAGLLHDASHTAFSHVADFVFHGQEKGDLSYQDAMHTWHLQQQGLDQVLKPYALTVEELDPHTNVFPMLEQPLPDLCADRIDYNLQTGYVLGLITQQEVQAILADLRYSRGRWYFINPDSARKLADVALYSTHKIFSSVTNAGLNIGYAQALRRAMDKGHIHLNEFIFGTDATLQKKLETFAEKDRPTKKMLQQAKTIHEHLVPTQEHRHHTVRWTTKFRGVDPWILMPQGTFQRLTHIDPHYKAYYEEVKASVAQDQFFRPKSKKDRANAKGVRH